MRQYSAKTSEDTAHPAGEIPFPFEELFFSRTNEKGHILSGNSVFQRISLFSWDELLGQPHNIIRHQDMPRAVFWLLWDTIKQGEPIGAYVKNRAKDGRYYWVFAIVTPIEGGYLSVRLKPSSPLFPAVELEYAPLVALEGRERVKPAESAKQLLARLAELGFKDYGAFMAAALGQEITARDRQLRRPPDPAIAAFDALSNAAKTLLQHADSICAVYAVNAYVPMNLRVQAAQLGEAGATIGVISDNYSVISDEIKSRLDEFTTAAQQVSKAVNRGLFLLCTAKIQAEVLELFHGEPASSAFSQETEIALLDRQRRTYQQSAIDGLHAIESQAERFHQSCTEMKRLAAGLEVTRVMGKVESSRLSVAKDGLNDLIDTLESFQTSVLDSLKEIDTMNRAIQRNIQQLLSVTNAARPARPAPAQQVA
jgi:PAS domain S-box-containing protein